MEKNFSSKEFAKVVKSANQELKGTFKSPFVIVNLLNKAAKGDFAKVSGVEGITKENLSTVAKVVKNLHKGRYYFDMCLFEKDYKGRFCTLQPYKEPVCMYDFLGGDIVTDAKGREIRLTDEGAVLFVVVPLTVTGVFNAFAKVAKIDIKNAEKVAKDMEKAQRANEKAAKKAAKFAAQRAKELSLQYIKGQISELEFSEELAKIKVG